MKSKPVKVWVVWFWSQGRWWPTDSLRYWRKDAEAWRKVVAGGGPRYRITCGTVMPPGEGKP